MKFDTIYKKKIPLYKRGRCDGPTTYTYKYDGFRLFWLNKTSRCNFCNHLTNWGAIYFYPSERFKSWDNRDFNAYFICSEEELDSFKSRIIENKIMKNRDTYFVPKIFKGTTKELIYKIRQEEKNKR